MEFVEGHGCQAQAGDEGGEDVEDAVEALESFEDEAGAETVLFVD